jgi:hypothetical protein
MIDYKISSGMREFYPSFKLSFLSDCLTADISLDIKIQKKIFNKQNAGILKSNSKEVFKHVIKEILYKICTEKIKYCADLKVQYY